LPPPGPPASPTAWFKGSSGLVAGTHWIDTVTSDSFTATGTTGNLTTGTINGNNAAGWTSSGSQSYYTNASAPLSTFLSSTAWTIGIVFGPGTMGLSTNTGGSPYTYPCLCGDGPGNWVICAGSTGAPNHAVTVSALWDNGGNYYTTATGANNTDSSSHYVIAQLYSTGTEMSLAIDGGTASVRSIPAGTITLTNALEIGYGNGNANNQYQGLIEEIIIYNTDVSTSTLGTYLAGRV